MKSLPASVLALVLALPLAVRGDEGPAPAPGAPAAAAAGEAVAKPAGQTELGAALARLKLPGVKIDLEKRCVDVESSVCLHEGMLEFIACTRDTKEHESIIVVGAKPSHIHTALLLLGATPGNPAMRKPIDEEGTRWIDLPPRGGPIDVFLVVKDSDGKEGERPISDFIEPAESPDGPGGVEDAEDGKFPTHTFVFAGSILYGEGEGPRKYLADQSGSVISLSTFGDELLCLPGIYGHDNGMLTWQVKADGLPEVGAKLTLRLRPQLKPRPVPKTGG